MRLGTILSALVISSAAQAGGPPELSGRFGDGARLELSGTRWLRVGGLLQADAVRFDEDVTSLQNNQDVRRARLRLSARMDDWQALVDYDFGISPGWKNVQLQYRGWDQIRVVAGNQPTPFSLEDVMGNHRQVFLERSLASALSPGLLSGVSFRNWRDGWTLSAGVFGNELSDQGRRDMDGLSLIARSTYAPIDTQDRALQFGVSHEQRRISGDDPVRVRSRPETRLTDARLVDTRRFTGIDRVATTGLEMLGLHRGVKLQGEFLQARLHGSATDTLEGGYVMMTALLTGETYRYQSSRGLARPGKPKRAWGALEAGIRYSTIDLTDGAVAGGQQKQLTAAFSWFANDSTRITVNYSHLDASPNRNGVPECGSVLMLRLQTAL